MDGWLERSLHCPMSVLFYKRIFGKWRKVTDGVLRGYCHVMGKVQSTCRVLPRKRRWSCLNDLVYEIKRVSPFLEIFTNNVLQFFSKDIEMSYNMVLDMLY
jgi:hypothetical protein